MASSSASPARGKSVRGKNKPKGDGSVLTSRLRNVSPSSNCCRQMLHDSSSRGDPVWHLVVGLLAMCMLQGTDDVI